MISIVRRIEEIHQLVNAQLADLVEAKQKVRELQALTVTLSDELLMLRAKQTFG
jgi:hypothetical protein